MACAIACETLIYQKQTLLHQRNTNQIKENQKKPKLSIKVIWEIRPKCKFEQKATKLGFNAWITFLYPFNTQPHQRDQEKPNQNENPMNFQLTCDDGHLGDLYHLTHFEPFY